MRLHISPAVESIHYQFTSYPVDCLRTVEMEEGGFVDFEAPSIEEEAGQHEAPIVGAGVVQNEDVNEEGEDAMGINEKDIRERAALDKLKREDREARERVLNAEATAEGGLILLEVANSLPSSQTSIGRAFSMKRLAKACIMEQSLPVGWETKLKITRQNKIDEAMWKELKLACQRTALKVNRSALKRMKDAVFVPAPQEGVRGEEEGAPGEKESGNIVANRVCGLAHLLLHPDARSLLSQINGGVAAVDKAAFQDQGAPEVRAGWWDELHAIFRRERESFVNNHGAAWPNLASFDPAKGDFADGAALRAMKTKVMNSFTTLKGNASKSGQQTNGPEWDQEVHDHYIGLKGRGHDYALFYVWLMWKGMDVSFLSNSLTPDVGQACGFDEDGNGGSNQSAMGSSEGLPHTTHEKRIQKKEQKQAKDGEILGKIVKDLLPATPDLTVAPVLHKSEVDKNEAIAIEKKAAAALMTAKAASEVTTCSNATDLHSFKKLKETMESPLFALLSDAKQEAARDRLAEFIGL
jgi:hypothetical protein